MAFHFCLLLTLATKLSTILAKNKGFVCKKKRKKDTFVPFLFLPVEGVVALKTFLRERTVFRAAVWTLHSVLCTKLFMLNSHR